MRQSMALWDVKACRSCLTVKGKLEKIGDASKRQYSAVTGLQISENDGYPTYFCMECRHHIRKSLAFRRKSRRAHFVLKEIMTIRKQVTYSDIVTVNRKRTNLESSLNFWKPSTNACFLIGLKGEEGQQEEGLQQYNLLEPKYSRSHSTPLVDIKPEVIEPETSDVPIENNEQENDTFNNEEIPTNDDLEPEGIDNIDMNDIFKDFNDGNENLSEDEFIEDRKDKTKPVKKEDDLGLTDSLYSGNAVAAALSMFDLKTLSLDEQKERIELRRKSLPYVTALYKCAVCLTVYTNMQQLLEHAATHNKRKYAHECQVCANKFRTAEELTIHVSSSHMYDYQCRTCRLKFYTQTAAVKHFKASHSNADSFIRRNKRTIYFKNKVKRALKNFTLSPMTQQMMYDVMKLQSRPRKKFKDVNASFKCDICRAWMKNKGNLEKHMNVQHRFMYTCKICKEVFTVRDQAVAHNDTHSKNEKRHVCNKCGMVFDEESKLVRHHKMKHTTKIPCNLCGYAALNENLLYKHQMQLHKYISLNDPLVGDPNHKCGQCEVQFMNKRALDFHLVNMNHTGSDNVENACIPCKKIYDDEEQLETHFITCPYPRKYPRKCCYCSEVLPSPVEYKRHYYKYHRSLPYRYVRQNAICDVCGKSIWKPYLETHLKTHIGDAYECRLCDATHPTPGTHVTHVISAHARRPYHCAFCDRRFRFRSDCKDHILKVHAPTMLYKCEFCSQEFSYFKRLKEHSETIHNLVIPPVKSRSQFKSKTKIFVYAHMKIHINELERPLVEQTEVELLDYLDQKSKPANYSDYFVFCPEAEAQENTITKKRVRMRKVKVKQSDLENTVVFNQATDDQGDIVEKKLKRQVKIKQDELESAVANITVQWPEQGVIEPTEIDSEVIEDSGVKSEIKTEVNSKIKTEVKSKVKNEVKVEVAQSEMEVDMETPLEVMESEEGTQYVMIDGELYRIACEDEVE